MEFIGNQWTSWLRWYDDLWELRDKRMDGLPLMGNPLYTIFLCSLYVYVVKVAGPNYMKNRPPLNIKNFMIGYNAFQVLLSGYIFVQLLRGGWWNDYSFRCQPVDYSDSYKAKLILQSSYIYFISKFVEFIDTLCFVARKKFSHVSFLHVVHHGILPMSVWPGARWVPGGHSTFFGLCNTFVHFFMYFYYMMAAMGPQYQKYIWWKRHMTNLQMIQFIAIFIHGSQLLIKNDCNYPTAFGYFIAAHAVLFFVLFAQFYVREYLDRGKSKENAKAIKDSNGYKELNNGSSQNGTVSNNVSPHRYNTRSKEKQL